MQATQKRKNNQIEDGRLQSLQVVRAFAFLGIFTCHAGMNQLGAWGASVFLVLSGFLLVYIYWDREVDSSLKGTMTFMVRRIGKLYPLHLLMLAAALPFTIKVLLDNFSSYYLLRSIGQVILNVCLVQSWIPKSAAYFSLNGVAWYLSVCVFLYLVFPWILKLMKRYCNQLRAWGSIVVLWGIQFTIAYLLRYTYVPMSVSDNLAKWVTYICPLFRLGDFLIGCNLGYLFLKHRLQLNAIVATLGELAVFLILVISQKIYNGQYGFWSSEWFKLTVMYVPSSVMWVYLFALKQGWISRLLTCRVLIWIGNVSGYGFLIHQLVIRYLQELLIKNLQLDIGNMGIAVIAFVITLVLAMGYQRVISDQSMRRSLK